MKKTKMLKKNYEFRRVLSKGQYYSGFFIEAFVLNTKGNYLGLAINTKIGKAFQRNKIKRLIRECYRCFEDNTREGFSIVFLWKKKKEAKDADFFEIKKDIKNIMEKAKLMVI